MDRSVQIALVTLIVLAVAAAFLTRESGPTAPATPTDALARPQPASAQNTASAPDLGELTSTESTEAPSPDEGAAGDGEDAAQDAGQLPRFVEVGADSCIPCKMMQPILDELRTDYGGKLEVDFADVWKNPELGQRYDVRTIPTQVIYDASGREVFRHIGYWPKEEIDVKLKELGIVD
ncbi:MAG: thioredoxin family protein [Armatimonadota bacterium]